MIIFGIKLNNFGSIWLSNDLFGLKCHIPMFQSPVWGGGFSSRIKFKFTFFRGAPPPPSPKNFKNSIMSEF